MKMAKMNMERKLAKKQEKERQIEEQKAASAARKAKRDAVYDELCDIFGYEVQNTVLFTEWILWNKLADDEKILAYLKEHKDYIKGATARASGTEYAKIRYMSAILKNNLKDSDNNCECKVRRSGCGTRAGQRSR